MYRTFVYVAGRRTDPHAGCFLKIEKEHAQEAFRSSKFD